MSVFSPNSGNYAPEITPYLDTFHAVICQSTLVFNLVSTLCIYIFILISDMNKFVDYFKSVISTNLCGKRLKFLNNHM